MSVQQQATRKAAAPPAAAAAAAAPAAAAAALRGAQTCLASPTDLIRPGEGRATIFVRPGQHDSGLRSHNYGKHAEQGGSGHRQVVDSR